MPEWLIERGIGETRAALMENQRIIEARIVRDGVIAAGTVLQAKLKSVGRNPVAVADGREYLLPRGAAGVTEGATLNIEVTREDLGGAEPWKRPLARMTEQPTGSTPDLSGRDAATGEFDEAGWPDLIEEARSGIVRFPGGELCISPTPAMTLIDVDGSMPPDELALAGARAAAMTILRLDIGGSIGIDLPTAKGKAARQAAASALDAILPRPFERTAVNGFGFLQLVRPRRRASLVELAADRATFEARALLRQAAREIGATCLAAHPAVIAVLSTHRDWLDRLSCQVGGAVTLRSDASLAISGGHAEPA
ncbi:ribonuclease [Sphingomonas sp. RB56-2]|uniref:Ribonuclease n=1 Tax=Sphingomonas brevis TaxID=2908206 RepID=A0ABT0SAA9_9SPHN|nr:ribonuclease [Sphingomonas brevis]MCL6741293.1 ribonuclease [Sphingomonas brevis]